MIEGQFSRTALSAAGFRAAHQTAEGASLFADPLAGPILGDDLPALMERCADPVLRPLRIFVALRSRIGEGVARRAVEEGARQVVILGAGLDTFACRIAPKDGLRVFEVDHPSTQAEKRRRLAAAGVDAAAAPPFRPLRLRAAGARAGARRGGFRRQRPRGVPVARRYALSHGGGGGGDARLCREPRRRRGYRVRLREPARLDQIPPATACSTSAWPSASPRSASGSAAISPPTTCTRCCAASASPASSISARATSPSAWRRARRRRR